MRHVNVGLFVPHNGCPHQCSFCNQKTISGRTAQVTPEDIDRAVEVAVENPDSSEGEIAFFGGSFTAIDRGTMTALLERAYSYVRQGKFRGIRISTRPDAIDEDICRILKSFGVTAVELGAQSMDDRVLAMNLRGHSAEDVFRASEMLKSFGFELGLQMMTGLYGSTDGDSIATAEKLIALKPDTARIYPTVVLENTELARLYREGAYRPQTVDEAAELCSVLIEMFNDAGVRLIRVGLHSGGGVEEGYVAGAYHPALRELSESRIYMRKILAAVEESGIESGRVTIRVAPSEISKATGQKRSNINRLLGMGYVPKISADETLGKYQVLIRNEDLCD